MTSYSEISQQPLTRSYTQIWNLSVCDQTKCYKYFKRRRPLMENDLKWNILVTADRILSIYETKLNIMNASNEDDLQGKRTSTE